MKQFTLNALLATTLMFATTAFADETYSNVFVFGDSLSDTGNLALVRGPLPAPFYMNRISNGPVAVEKLAAQLGLTAEASGYLSGDLPTGTNYAVAGARARVRAVDEALIDLPTQVSAFLLHNYGTAPDDALYIVFIGGNDVRDARDEPNDHVAHDVLENAVSAIAANLRILIASGARKILVVNVPDLGKIPETRLIETTSGMRGFSHRATELTKRFNHVLRKKVKRINRELDAQIVLFDAYKTIGFILANSAALEYTNRADACFSIALQAFHPDCDFDEFVFFDEIHPSARTHERASRAMYAVVPEPRH